MRLGLVSDTHDNVGLASVAAALFRSKACDLVLHLGDITDGATVVAFQGLPMRFLQGNNDDTRELAPALARHAFPPLALAWRDRLDGLDVAAHHGHLPIRGDGPDVLLHGHSHRRRAERVGRTLVVNPGALHRANVRTVATLELPSMEVAFHEVLPTGTRPLS